MRMPPMVWCTVGTFGQAYQGPSVIGAASVLVATKPNLSDVPLFVAALLYFLTAIATAVEKDRKQRKTAAPDAVLAAKYESLMQRERQVVELVLMGLLNCQVAQRLNLSERTVETHRANVYRKLGVSNLNELRRLYGMMR